MRARCVIDMLVVTEGETPIHDRAGVPQVAVDAVRIHFQTRLPSDIAADDGPIICGNIARQPGLKMYPHRVHGDLRHASAVMDRGFSFGNHQHIDDAARAHIADSIDSFVKAN